MNNLFETPITKWYLAKNSKEEKTAIDWAEDGIKCQCGWQAIVTCSLSRYDERMDWTIACNAHFCYRCIIANQKLDQETAEYYHEAYYWTSEWWKQHEAR